MKKILIIDDEIITRISLLKLLTKNGFDVKYATTGGTAMEILSEQIFDLVLCDYRLKDASGKDILIKIKKDYSKTCVIIITGYSDIKVAVELIKLGAYDYITKPLYTDEILNTINRALETTYPVNTSPSSDKDAAVQLCMYDTDYVEGTSEASVNLSKQVALIATTSYSIILTGKSGTGKEYVAKTIHLNSRRKNKPFIAMDCGSLTKELAGSEFFGHEKGAFTGALYTKIGHFEQANGGTLFLDEIGNLTYDIQATLLRAVQERKIKRIGSTKEIELDVRLIVATNENLTQKIAKGTFREDLYHRFNEFSIHIPPLKKRKDDILIFANKFLTIINRELNKNITGFSAEVKDCLINYSWPGNVRELKNVIRRIALLSSDDEIQLAALPVELTDYIKKVNREKSLAELKSKCMENPGGLKNVVREAQFETILRVLEEVNFNKTKAAKLLGIDRKTLYNKMKAKNT